ncbi:MAG: type II secretion system F family protein [Cellvibrionaceae bacterium]|nr:type II secretion system F family protein [Cellvibrionaceae bacterium]MCV6624724.1 type II secretion system F family protein [Cellvibrionaceae bacterium]
MFYFLLILVLIPVIAWVFLFGNAWFQRARVGDEAWRDRPPVWLVALRPFINMLLPLFSIFFNEKSTRNIKLADKLSLAGFTYAIKPVEFEAARWLMLLIGLIFAYQTAGILDDIYPEMKHLAWSLAILGFFYADIWLADMVKRRKTLISKDFPFFLELLVLSMRAGLNLSSAIRHATEKIKAGPLRDELELYIRTVRIGTSRRAGLDEFASRVSLPQVSNFVAAVNQAEEVGGELGELLSKQAAQRRKERFLLAEEKANKAPVKMLFPLIACLFPMTFIIIGFTLYIKARDSGALSFLSG